MCVCNFAKTSDTNGSKINFYFKKLQKHIRHFLTPLSYILGMKYNHWYIIIVVHVSNKWVLVVTYGERIQSPPLLMFKLILVLLSW